MSSITRYVISDAAGQEGAFEYESLAEAKADASDRGAAVVERTYAYEDSELVWTPDGSKSWPPDAAEENGPENDAAWGLTSESAGDPEPLTVKAHLEAQDLVRAQGVRAFGQRVLEAAKVAVREARDRTDSDHDAVEAFTGGFLDADILLTAGLMALMRGQP